MLFVFIYVYWCSTRFPYHMMFVTLTVMTGVTSGAGPAYPSWSLEFTSVFGGVRVAQSLVFYVVFCRSLFVILSFLLWPLFCLPFCHWWLL